MPKLKIKNNENEQEFVSRCISYIKKNESGKYKGDDQIAAVCYSMWEDKKESVVSIRKYLENDISAKTYIELLTLKEVKDDKDNTATTK